MIIMKHILLGLANGQKHFINFLRIAISIVMLWIGSLKAFHYEADGIVPFVANSPIMNFFYNKQTPDYQAYKNMEGKEVSKNIHWHTENGTYTFSYFLGAAIMAIGIATAMGIFFPKTGLYGGLLTAIMAAVTLSFLITTPEVYVPALGGDFPTAHHGFPFLSGAGRLVLKDVIMMAAGLVCASDAAQRIVQKDLQHKKTG
jgi:reactive chlorine resistance protein C